MKGNETKPLLSRKMNRIKPSLAPKMKGNRTKKSKSQKRQMATQPNDEHWHPIPLEKQVIPQQYMGKKITKEDALKLMENEKNDQDQVPGLIYSHEQLPTRKLDRGWLHVIRCSKQQPWDKRKYKISSKYPGEDKERVIYVHYQDETVVSTDRKAALENGIQSLLEPHKETGPADGESGVLVCHGTTVDYKRTRDMVAYHQALNSIIQNSVCGKVLRKVITKSHGDVLQFGRNKEDVCLARGACSSSLSTSARRNVSDASPSFAVFFRESGNTDGQAWFLFPSISTAIELSHKPCVISWNGTHELHCSKTVRPGILGGYLFRNKFVDHHFRVKKAFENGSIPHNKNLQQGDEVVVRKRVGKTWSNMNGTVVSREKGCCRVQFCDGNTEEVSFDNIAKLSVVRSLEVQIVQ